MAGGGKESRMHNRLQELGLLDFLLLFLFIVFFLVLV